MDKGLKHYLENLRYSLRKIAQRVDQAEYGNAMYTLGAINRDLDYRIKTGDFEIIEEADTNEECDEDCENEKDDMDKVLKDILGSLCVQVTKCKNG